MRAAEQFLSEQLSVERDPGAGMTFLAFDAGR